MDINNAVKLFMCFLMVIGAVECFCGLKMTKALPIWNFIIGVSIGILLGKSVNSFLLGVIFAFVLGAALVVLSFRIRSVGIFIFVSYSLWATVYMMSGNMIVSAIPAMAAGVLALFYKKSVSLVVSAVAGAGMSISCAFLIMGMIPKNVAVIIVILWLPITVVGIIVQYITKNDAKIRKTHKYSG